MDIFDLINKNLKNIELDLGNAKNALNAAEEELEKLKQSFNPGIDKTSEVL